MERTASSTSRGWPIGHAALAALLDVGLSCEQIARYFGVPPHEVGRLLHAGVSAGPRQR